MVFYFILIACIVLVLLATIVSGGESKKGSGMSPAEARKVLGVSLDATEDEIQEAYRRLMQKNHPDQGGSDYIAQKLNEARDALIKK